MVQTPAGYDLPSSLGGEGWMARTASHRSEVAAGVLWTRCGYRSEVSRLRSVLLTAPPESLGAVRQVRRHLMREPVDRGAIRDQAAAVAQAYRDNGVSVTIVDVPADAPPNVVFMRDLFLATPDGAIVARTASVQRAGEERHAAQALADLGVPILATVAGEATFEGADALWLDSETVVLGTGFRTNVAGARTVAEALRAQDAAVVCVPLGAGVQHLLGAVAFLDERLAAVHGGVAMPELRQLLDLHGYRVVELPHDEELARARGMNLVAIAPGQVLMPTGAPGIQRRLADAGVDVQTVDVSEFVKADGALGCLTGVVHRD